MSDVKADNLNVESFVVIPFRPPGGWYAARVVEVDLKMKKIKLDWLYSNNKIDFSHKTPGDVGYVKPTDEYMSNILCVIPPPDTYVLPLLLK